MGVVIRRSEDRGVTKLDWLESRHTFSFGSYRDREHMGFGTLRVINEDRIRPGMGFGTHPHRDMEIVTYVIDGVLAHEDSMGNGSVIQAGDVQRMTAGTGVTHSEYNHSPSEIVHLLQIWILPDQLDLEPGYEQRSFERKVTESLQLVASKDGREGSVTIHQDASLYQGVLSDRRPVDHVVHNGRQGWLQVVRGTLDCNGATVREGDGAALTPDNVNLRAQGHAELLFFDLPGIAP